MGCSPGLHPGQVQAIGCVHFRFGGDHVDDCTLPGFAARYLTRFPGTHVSRVNHKVPYQLSSDAAIDAAIENLLA